MFYKIPNYPQSDDELKFKEGHKRHIPTKYVLEDNSKLGCPKILDIRSRILIMKHGDSRL